MNADTTQQELVHCYLDTTKAQNNKQQSLLAAGLFKIIWQCFETLGEFHLDAEDPFMSVVDMTTLTSSGSKKNKK